MSYVLMIGTEGSGKTTFLASLYNARGKMGTTTDIRLGNQYPKLQEWAQALAADGTCPPPTERATEYLFGVQQEGLPDAAVYLTDYPGGLLTGTRSDARQIKKLQSMVERSTGCIVFLKGKKMKDDDAQWQQELAVLENCLLSAVKDRDRIYRIVVLITGECSMNVVRNYDGFRHLQQLVDDVRSCADLDISMHVLHVDCHPQCIARGVVQDMTEWDYRMHLDSMLNSRKTQEKELAELKGENWFERFYLLIGDILIVIVNILLSIFEADGFTPNFAKAGRAERKLEDLNKTINRLKTVLDGFSHRRLKDSKTTTKRGSA